MRVLPATPFVGHTFLLMAVLMMSVVSAISCARAAHVPRVADYPEGSVQREYVAVMRSDLRNLVTAQEVYFAEHMRYASTVDELREQYGHYRASSGVQIAVRGAAAGGWAGAARHESLPGVECRVFVGGPPADLVAGQREGVPLCVTADR